MKPSVLFTQDLADHICARIANGESLSAICDEDGMPTPGQIVYWRRQRPEFELQYEAARVMQAETLFDQLLLIADDGRNDYMEKIARDGETFISLDREHINRSKIRIETRLKMIERMNPAKYGERMEVDHKSSDGSMSPANMTDEERAAKILAILKKAEARRERASKAKGLDDGSDLV